MLSFSKRLCLVLAEDRSGVVGQTILGCLVGEIATFAAAILLHSGIPIFGRVEERGIVEAFVQGTIGAAVAICAYSFWKRKAWARMASLVCQLVGIGGALFGMFVVLVQDDALNSIRTMRGN